MMNKKKGTTAYWVGGGIGVAVFLSGLFALGNWALVNWKISQVKTYLEKGFPALAADTLEPIRHTVLRKPSGCPLLLTTYQRSRHLDRLEWASQGCLNLDREPVMAILSLANIRQQTGREMEALQVLDQGAQRFDKIPDFFYAAAQLFRQIKRESEAIAAFHQAIERAPENLNLVLETVDYLLSLNKKTEAKELADKKLKPMESELAEYKLILARVYSRLGEASVSKQFQEQGRAILAKMEPDAKAQVEAAFADVLK